MNDTLEFPDFLSDYSQFKQHLDTTLENLSPKEKGDKFAEFSRRIIPFLETGIDWDNLRLNQASHDGGIDIIGESSDKKNILYGQSKDSERSQRQSVNNAILYTVMKEPEKMLARNNGITFKADSVEFSNQNTLILKQASIVNGCQSTMCMMKNPSDDLYVVVKIVETHDSWDIARSANFQNEVKQIKLELASYIRPQIVKKAASFTGEFKINTKADSAFEVLESIYETSIVYELSCFSEYSSKLFSR